MTANPKVSRAIAAILSASALGLDVAYAATADEASDSGAIQQVTVTAQRREESAQDVPITIQAITGAQLGQLQVTTMDDVIKYLPNVTLGQNGPGQGNIFMRGLSAGFQGNQSSATIAQFPNVAAYLDDQSMQFPNHNLDIYMVDMERIEVLEGPQGTLFGGGAEAGLVRYITNKPKLDKTEGNAEASYGTTAGGDNNSSLNATLNLPIIPGTFALRGVIYNERRGGYIDNVPSTFTRQNSDLGNFYTGIVSPTVGVCPNGQPGTVPGKSYCAPVNSAVVNNNSLAQQNENPVTYIGTRVSGLYQINDDWNVLVAQSYQNMEADGEFMQFPLGSEGQPLGPDQITQFSPAYDKDKYENTAWTVNGAFGDFKAVYTGGYLVRHIDQTEDYTNYARSAGGFYYSCTGGSGLGSGTTPTCYSPITSWHDKVRNTHLSHEVRVSTPESWFVRGLAGAYYEDFKIEDVMNFLYKTIPSCTPGNLAASLAGGLPCLGNVRTAPGSTATDPGVRDDNTAFGEDAQRGYKQTALFASADYDLIPKVLTITGGTRWYHYTEFETGSVYATGTSCVDVPNGQCTGGMTNIDGENLRASYRGFRSRANLTWHITPDTMSYFTFSQGFRPGAFNRSQRDKANILDTRVTPNQVVPQFKTPAGYAPDSLTNFEVGLKSEFFDHRLQVNLSAYHMIWKDVQLLFYNPVALGNTTFGITGPKYNVDGVELQFTARATQGLTLMGSGSYNRAKQKSSPCLISNEPSSPTLGQCITQTYDPASKTNVAFQNPFGALDTTPAFSPELQFNVRGRYDWAFNEYEMFVMAGANHVGSMSNQPATYKDGSSVVVPDTTFLRYTQPAYTTYDASLGVSKDNWTVQLFGNNLSNSNASVFTSSAQFIKSEVPLRPRVLGAKIGFKF